MRKSPFSLLKNLGCLNQIFSVKGAIVVGAGFGEGLWFEFLQQVDTNVLLVEADPDKIQHLKNKFYENSSWDIKHQIVGNQEGEGIFFEVANSSESSLLKPEILKDVWPNIKLKQQYYCQTVNLNGLLLENDILPNWLILDCLPVLPLLQGAEPTLAHVDVVVARVITDCELCIGAQASYRDIEIFMQERGFISVGLQHERNPALAHTLYLRDYVDMVQKQKAEWQSEKEKFTHQFEIERQDFQLQLDRLKRKHEVNEKRATEATVKLKQESLVEKNRLQQQFGDLDKKYQQSKQIIKEMTAREKELQNNLSTKQKEKEELNQMCHEVEQNLQKLGIEKQKLQEWFDNLKQQKITADNSLEQKNTENKQLQEKIEVLQSKLAKIEKNNIALGSKNIELIGRQKALNEELAKAEDQLVMIKELLLNELS